MKIKLSVFLYVLIFILVFWNFLLPGAKVAHDLPFISDELLSVQVKFPQTWFEYGAEGLGEYVAFFLWSWPLTFISGLLFRLGLNFALIEKLFLVTPILVLGSLGIWKLSNFLKLSDYGKFIASAFYLLNTYILLLIDGGQLSVALAYSFLPISIYAIEKSIDNSFTKKITAGLSVATLGFLDFRFIYILSLFCLLRFLYQLSLINNKEKVIWIRKWVKIDLVSLLIILGLNAYWLLVLIKAPISSTTFSFFTQTSFSSFGNIGHSILFLAPHWYKNVFGQISPLRFEFIFIPILVFLAPILRHKSKEVGFWILIALTAIFFTKGVTEPLPNMYQWLFTNIPGFSLFRDPSKFFVLLALSYSLLLGVTCDEFVKSFGVVVKRKIVITLGIISYFLLLINPIFLNQMTGMFSKPLLESEFSELADVLKEDEHFSRVFWIPYRTPLGYSSPNHPVEEASRLAQKRPFNIGIKGTYETFNFLREAPFMGEIFDVSGIGYIVYPPLDPRRDEMKEDNVRYYQTFSMQLSNLNWLTKVDESPINLWKVKSHQDKFFITDDVWWVIGSDDIYKQSLRSDDLNESTKSVSLKLSKNALIFAEEQSDLGRRLDELPEAKIIFNNKTMTDLAASFIDPSHLIFPAKQLNFEPDKSGWWKREAADLIRWRDFLQTKYGIDNLDFDLGGGWAVGEGNLKLKVQSEKFKKEGILLARVMENSKSGQLKFYQKDKLIGEINTKKEGNNMRWFEVGALVNDGQLTMQSSGDINVVNALAILGKKEWFDYKSKTQLLEEEGRIVNYDVFHPKKSQAQVTYEKVSPTKYRVRISNLKSPAMLVFSESYDHLWRMGDQYSFPIYSFLNGFTIDKDGEYMVEFEPQKYVYPGLIISGLTSLLIALIIFKNIRSKSA